MARCKMESKLVPFSHGALPADEMARMEQHLAECASCASEMKVLRIMSHFQAPAVPEGPDIWPALRARIQARQRIPWWRTRPVLALGVTGILCAVLIVGSVRLRPSQDYGVVRNFHVTVDTKDHSAPVTVASLNDLVTGYPENYITEQFPSRGGYTPHPNPDPQLGGLMVCLGSGLVQSFSPVGPQPEPTEEDSVAGGGVGESPGARPLVAAPQGPPQEGDELITNGDFEELRGGLPVGWDISGASDPGLQFRLDDKISAWGKRSIAIERDADPNDTVADPNNWMQTIFRIPEGRMVQLTAYIRTRDVGLLDRRPANFSFAAVAVQCWDKDKKKVIAYTSTQTTAGQVQRQTDWKQYTASLRVPEGTGAITVRAMLVGNGRAWFDGISLKVGTEAPAAGGNLLANGGFEEKQAERIVPMDWFQAQRAERPGLRFYRDTLIKRTGEASATILNANSRNQGGNNWAQVILDPPAGRKLHLSGYVRTKSEDPDFKVSLAIQCMDETLNEPIEQQSTQDKDAVADDQGWKHLTTEITVPDGTYAVVVRAVARGTGRAWFDDLSLTAE